MFAPSSYDLIWAVVALLALGLAFSALSLWFRTRWERTRDSVLALLVILVVPVLGPVAFLASRRRRPAGPAD